MGFYWQWRARTFVHLFGFSFKQEGAHEHMSRWADDQMTRWPDDQMTRGPDDHMIWGPDDHMTTVLLPTWKRSYFFVYIKLAIRTRPRWDGAASSAEDRKETPKSQRLTWERRYLSKKWKKMRMKMSMGPKRDAQQQKGPQFPAGISLGWNWSYW